MSQETQTHQYDIALEDERLQAQHQLDEIEAVYGKSNRMEPTTRHDQTRVRAVGHNEVRKMQLRDVPVICSPIQKANDNHARGTANGRTTLPAVSRGR
jgi:hypothetical protein